MHDPMVVLFEVNAPIPVAGWLDQLGVARKK